MKIAVIGAGMVGSAVARGVARAGHSVVITDRDHDEARQVAEAVGGTTAASNADAVREADLVVLAVPFGVVDRVAKDIADAVRGTIVVDATNPIRGDGSGLAVTDRAGARLLQDALPGASVVKAFNTVFSTNQAEPTVDGVQLDGFIAGDDDAAKRTVADLLAAIGYRPIDVGGLDLALALEHMAYLNISFNARNNLPWRSGWKLVGPVG